MHVDSVESGDGSRKIGRRVVAGRVESLDEDVRRNSSQHRRVSIIFEQ
jgi:hypothetical protein